MKERTCIEYLSAIENGRPWTKGEIRSFLERQIQQNLSVSKDEASKTVACVLDDLVLDDEQDRWTTEPMYGNHIRDLFETDLGFGSDHHAAHALFDMMKP